MKLVIIGAGIAGAVAYNALKPHTPRVFTMEDSETVGLKKHKALMRIRDPKLGLLVGCNLAPITIQKMVYFKGELHHQTNITASNLYSLKAYEGIDHHSVDHLGSTQRYLVTSEINIDNCAYGYQLIRAKRNRLSFIWKGKRTTVDYDYAISTIPLHTLMKACELDHYPTDLFRAEPICVYRAKALVPCKVNQTVYIPELEYNTYRITLQGQDIIFECIDEIAVEEREELLKLFGLTGAMISPLQLFIQEQGKISTTDDAMRKKLIWEITEEHNIFSFGRFGIWKSIRADHLLEDIEKIKKMIELREAGHSYEIEKTKIIHQT